MLVSSEDGAQELPASTSLARDRPSPTDPPPQQARDERSSVECVGFSAAHPYLATGGTDGLAKVFDMHTTQVRHRLHHADGQAVTRLKWRQQVLYTACTDGIVRLFDARSGECVKQVRGHSDAVLGLDLGGAGAQLATASDDHTVRFYADVGALP